MHLLKDKMYSVEFIRFKDLEQYNRFSSGTMTDYEIFRSAVFYSKEAIETQLSGMTQPEQTILESLLRAIYLAYVSLNQDWELVE